MRGQIKVSKKRIETKRKKDVKRAATVANTAQVVGVSTSHVQKVLRGDRNSETVIAVFMELTERQSRLIDEVKKLVPFL